MKLKLVRVAEKLMCLSSRFYNIIYPQELEN